MALITTLISAPDAVEQVRDKIGEILLTECAGQMALAAAAGSDPDLWRLRVFTERSLAFEHFWDSPDKWEGEGTQCPIVNLWFDSDQFDKSRSNVVERQATTAKYNLDCYGYAKSEAAVAGHVPGDQKAALEAQRCMRLVRNILMAGHYTYLGLRGTVGQRWITGRQTFMPPAERVPTAQHVVGARIVLEVQFNEFSPQVEGVTITAIEVRVSRNSEGELYLADTISL